ncbi:hypothetical protein LXL04_023972 [Taraxacum kok-saghyz]
MIGMYNFLRLRTCEEHSLLRSIITSVSLISPISAYTLLAFHGPLLGIHCAPRFLIFLSRTTTTAMRKYTCIGITALFKRDPKRFEARQLVESKLCIFSKSLGVLMLPLCHIC